MPILSTQLSGAFSWSTHTFLSKNTAWKVGKYFLTRCSVTETKSVMGNINLYSTFLQCFRAVSSKQLPWSLMANSSSDPRVHNSSGSGWWDLRMPARRKPKPVSFLAKDMAFTCQNSSPPENENLNSGSLQVPSLLLTGERIPSKRDCRHTTLVKGYFWHRTQNKPNQLIPSTGVHAASSCCNSTFQYSLEFTLYLIQRS